jgi:hypothetical protein
MYVPPAADHCSISLVPLDVLRRENRLVRLKTCGHLFDRVSIHTWVARNPSCPVCRGRVTIHDICVEESLATTISRIFWTILEFMWKGILILCEVSLVSNMSRSSYVYRAPACRRPLHSAHYAPPPADIYVRQETSTYASKRAALGTRA